ncbi:S-adenosyl-L-methionine-dependent methyltransferase [Hypoxylon trugodes]|uniref:S-adenosyl-L-methionine-dependent methyltransferase n=1 Tax=Hypoxylon trugodes TaxID=326681 RepID=UPI00218EFA61|nr:S-adenosyl-L-methionine-dependent methyltransferase [Hypoxylon trugodes]KAI1390645.1 S-adenosyl-L-methionine-dependent methyltransferase [Hypoxylon trugodes]
MAGASSGAGRDTDSGYAESFAWRSSRTVSVNQDASLLSWGSGSAPSLPSVDNESQADTMSISESLRSSTASINSSLYHFIQENGRTYHRYKEGRYFLPNDAEEQERLDLQHQLFIIAIGNKLNIAPIPDNPPRVLDIATGTGIWAIEFAIQHPRSEVIGTDLSPIQPEFLPENCRFEIDDAEDEWVYSEPFDFIHGRALMSCFNDPAAVVRQAFANLAPGGVLEFQDALFPMNYIGEPPRESALYRWNEKMLEGVARLGRSWSNAQNYHRYFEEAGFEDIVEKRFYWPTSPWAKGLYFKTVATYFQEDMLMGLEGVSLKVLAGLGMSPEEVREFAEEVKKDFKDTSIHAYLTVTYIYGKKPNRTTAR